MTTSQAPSTYILTEAEAATRAGVAASLHLADPSSCPPPARGVKCYGCGLELHIHPDSDACMLDPGFDSWDVPWILGPGPAWFAVGPGCDLGVDSSDWEEADEYPLGPVSSSTPWGSK